MKNYQKVLALVLAAVLLMAGTFLATVAWMTSNEDAKKNVFTVGNLDITLDEVTDVIGEGGEANGTSYEGIMPGDHLVKEVTLENNGQVPVYAAVTVTVNKMDLVRKAIDEYYAAEGQDKIQAIYGHVFAGWGMNADATGKGMAPTITGADMPKGALQVDAVMNTDTGLIAYTDNWLAADVYAAGNTNMDIPALGANELRYTYMVKLNPGDKFVPFTGLNVPEYFDNAQMDMFNGLNITVDAAAIQADNIGTAKDAIQALYGVTTPVVPDVQVSSSAQLNEAVANETEAVIALAAGDYTTNLKVAGGKDLTFVGEGADKTVISGQIATTASTEGTLILKDMTIKVDSSIVDQTGISQTGKSAIAIWGNQTVICENVTFDMSLANSTAITSWWDTGKGTTIIARNCTFNCNGQRPIRATGNVTVEGCTFNDPYRYAVQLTAKASTATELTNAVINFNDNTIVNGPNGKTFVYGIQLEGADYGCNHCIINGEGNTIVDGGTESAMYYCECGKVEHSTIVWNTEVAAVHEQ